MSQLVPYTSYSVDLEDSLMYTTMFDWKADDRKNCLVNFDGLNSGVPTRTTATLTPTTLRSIEQTFIDLQGQTEHSNQAGFVPPPVTSNSLGVSQTIGFGGGSLRVSPGPGSNSGSIDSGPSTSPAVSPSPSVVSTSTPAPTRRRGMGGRRPTNHQFLTPEEEERRNVRRERNKMAAARCRKRRLDHTLELEDETKGLEKKKQSLQDEIRQLQQSKEELEFILETHRQCCRMQSRRTTSPPDVKPDYQILMASEKRDDVIYPVENNTDGNIRVKEEVLEPPIILDNDVFTSPQTNKRVMLSSANPQVLTPMSAGSQNVQKPSRPNFLNVPLSLAPSQAHGLKNNNSLSDVTGIAITTPSNGMQLNFDSLMEGGTGLTPVQPCATQQQKSQPEIGSPDTMNPTKLEHGIK